MIAVATAHAVKKKKTFSDVNECLNTTDFCNTAGHGVCENLPGAYSCSCQSGFSGNGTICLGEQLSFLVSLIRDVFLLKNACLFRR